MRISDWSSDVCSSDLTGQAARCARCLKCRLKRPVRCRKGYGDGKTPTVDTCTDRDCGAMQFGDTGDDRQAESAALLSGPETAIETVERPLTVADAQTRAVIGHGQRQRCRAAAQRDIDRTAGARDRKSVGQGKRGAVRVELGGR